MRFIVELPDKVQGDYNLALENRRKMILDGLRTQFSAELVSQAQVMIDDRPEPMDFVREIGTWPGHNGYRTVYVYFLNGTSACSCHPQTAKHCPSLRV